LWYAALLDLTQIEILMEDDQKRRLVYSKRPATAI
jgi:hypothetical protein